jgi:histidinol-phosphate aminotransferase
MGLNRREWMGAAGLAAAGLAAAPGLARATAPTPVNLSLNENPWGPSPRAIEAMQAHMSRVTRYATPETLALAELVAAEAGVSPDRVVIGAGSSPILRACGELMGRPGSELLTGAATFESLYRGAAERGAEVVFVPFDAQMRFDLDAILDRLGPKTCGVYICNPNNPTSTAVDADRLRAFAIEASKTAPVFIDEAYIDMMDDWPKSTVMDLVREPHNIIVCRTFSKLHGLAGLRIGYAITPPDMAADVRRKVSSGGLNRLGLVAAAASFQDTAFREEMRLRLIRGRNRMVEMAERLGLTYAPDPKANYLYVRHGMKNADFVARMDAAGVMVVRRAFPGFDAWNRICVGTDAELAACETALKSVLA